LPLPASTTVRRTLVPAGPLIRAAAASAETPAIDLPLTPTIRSPVPIPASLAGAPAKTCATRRPFFVSVTVTPIPENSPEVEAWNRL
jgi:hypothetical protein